MNPLAIIGLILPIIENLPTIETGVATLIHSIEAMVNGGLDAGAVLGAVKDSLPALNNAIVKNTPQQGSTNPLS